MPWLQPEQFMQHAKSPCGPYVLATRSHMTMLAAWSYSCLTPSGIHGAMDAQGRARNMERTSKLPPSSHCSLPTTQALDTTHHSCMHTDPYTPHPPGLPHTPPPTASNAMLHAPLLPRPQPSQAAPTRYIYTLSHTLILHVCIVTHRTVLS